MQTFVPKQKRLLTIKIEGKNTAEDNLSLVLFTSPGEDLDHANTLLTPC